MMELATGVFTSFRKANGRAGAIVIILFWLFNGYSFAEEKRSTYEKLMCPSGVSSFQIGDRESVPYLRMGASFVEITFALDGAGDDLRPYTRGHRALRIAERAVRLFGLTDGAGRMIGGNCAGYLGLDDAIAKPLLGAWDSLRGPSRIHNRAEDAPLSATNLRKSILHDSEVRSLKRVRLSAHPLD